LSLTTTSFILILLRPPPSTLFPYTTLFRSPDNASWPSCVCTRAASVSKLLRMSVGNVHKNTRPGSDRLNTTAPPTHAPVGGAGRHRNPDAHAAAGVLRRRPR